MLTDAEVKNHAGDCSIYDADVRLCDCGLGRASMAKGNDEGEKHFCRLQEIAGLARDRRAMAERLDTLEKRKRCLECGGEISVAGEMEGPEEICRVCRITADYKNLLSDFKERGERLAGMEKALERIDELNENCQHAAMLPLAAHIQIEGLKGCLQQTRKIALSALKGGGDE